jgi:hypothetical protein
MKSQYWMWILWPAFLLAGILEMAVFTVVDPQDLHWMGHGLGLSKNGIYSIAFMFFWCVTSVCSAMTLWLSITPEKTQ